MPARVRDDGPSTALFRIETEYLPNAVVVREETTPKWPLGRYAFKRGADSVLVISRITSFGEKLGKKQAEEGIIPNRYDKVLERVWITLSLDTAIGEELDLELLERRFQVVYDEGEVDGDIFVQPNRVLGTIMLLEENEGNLVVDIDMVVETKRMPSWSVRNHRLSIPASYLGVRARPATDYSPLASLEQEEPAEEQVAEGGFEEGDLLVQDLILAQTEPVSATPQPAEEEVVADDYSFEQEAIGQWLGDNGKYEFRFQFEADGRFVYSTCRNNAPPMLIWGTYEFKNTFLILKSHFLSGFETMTTGVGPRDPAPHPVTVVRCTKNGDGTVLFQVIAPDDATFRKPNGSRVLVEKTRFTSLYDAKPPTRRKEKN